MKNPIQLLLLSVLLVLLSNPLMSKGVDFINGSWSDIKILAHQQQKPIFVKVHADWCIPCKDLDARIFSQSEVGAYYNENFINYVVDVDSPEGKQFKHIHHVTFIPDLLFFASNGQLLFRNNQLNNKVQILAVAYSALHKSTYRAVSLNESPLKKDDVQSYGQFNIELMQKQFNAGFQSSSFLHDYAYALEVYELPYEEVVNKYLRKERKKKRLLSNKNQKFIFHFSENIETEALNILLQEKKYFAKSFGLQNIDNKIKGTLFSSTLDAAFAKNPDLFRKVKQLTKKAGLSDEHHFLYILESKYFEYLKDWKNYIEVTYNFMGVYKENDPIFLNNQAISLLRISETKETLEKAKQWTEESIYIHPQDYNYQTYAYILYKLGEVKAAKVASEKASKFNERLPLDKKSTMPKTNKPSSESYLKT